MEIQATQKVAAVKFVMMPELKVVEIGEKRKMTPSERACKHKEMIEINGADECEICGMSATKIYILSLESRVKRLSEALETLKVAVNDKQPDPGAVNFICKALESEE